MHRLVASLAAGAAGVALAGHLAGAPADPFPLDRAAERWVQETVKKLTLDEKVGQLLVPSFETSFLSTDSDTFDELTRLVRDYHVGGFHVFGASEAAPSVLLNPTYGTVTLGQPFAAAFLINRLQGLATVPLLNSADFETGVGFRLLGATTFPRQMAFGAAGDPRFAREAARMTAGEARAVGVQVNFAPVADVNNNPRNPVINTRSYGEAPQRVGALVAAYLDGAREGGMVATLKHFPGHGDTDVDTHLGLATIPHDRVRLDAIEFVPFRIGIDRGAQAIMTSHIALPAIDPAPSTPTTFSAPIVTGVLRQDLGFGGLVYTDSMSMDGVTKLSEPGEAVVRAIAAGADVAIHSPDPIAAFNALKAAVTSGRINEARLNESVVRILRAKAFVGLHKERRIDLDAVPSKVGGRANQAFAREIAARSVTLVKDDRHQVPLAVPRESPLLFLSVLDYPSGWHIAAPSRTFIPELKKRWPQVTAIELSDHTPLSEIDLVRSIAPRYGAVVAAVYVRAASASGRMDLAPDLVKLLKDLAHVTGRASVPFVVVLFGNPYVASYVSDVPAIMLTYDLYDLPEAAAVAALAGETPIGGRLPIALPGLFPVGHGLDRPIRSTAAR